MHKLKRIRENPEYSISVPRLEKDNKWLTKHILSSVVTYSLFQIIRITGLFFLDLLIHKNTTNENRKVLKNLHPLRSRRPRLTNQYGQICGEFLFFLPKPVPVCFKQGLVKIFLLKILNCFTSLSKLEN